VRDRVVGVDKLGECTIGSPFLIKKRPTFVSEDENVIYNVHQREHIEEMNGEGITYFELAGPRDKIYFEPSKIACGIVTCGGLCPGLNDVIQAIVVELSSRYGVKKVLGFRYGYKGLSKNSPREPMLLTPECVDDLHHKGGTVLGSSRGAHEVPEMVETLKKNGIKILFVIGGDGTIKGAAKIAEYIKENNLDISVIALPKTIDNDLKYVKMSFGFQTAVEKSMEVIASAHIEANGALNGIGLVKLMGRHSGFIAANASLANRDVNFCLIPEVSFRLEGDGGLFDSIEKRLQRKGHAIIVVAEGAGQNHIIEAGFDKMADASGNIVLKDIGLFLKREIKEHFKQKQIGINLKYIDPSYIIRSIPANAMDSIYCLQLGQNAVHAGMSGRTNVMVGYENHHYIHVPLPMAIKERNKVDANRRLWKSVMESTLQPETMFMC
jgi:6-phosphofructokinase 1